MSSITIRKIAAGFALLAFAVLVFGSLLSGARILTSFVRGFEAAIIFGLLAWGLSAMVVEERETIEPETPAEPDDKDNGENLTEVV